MTTPTTTTTNRPTLERVLGDKPRLLAVANHVPEGTIVVDVGCDHGWLPIALVQCGRSPRAIAVDIRPPPVALARRHVRQAGLSDQIDVFQSDGLADVPRGAADTLTIAGVGARTSVRVATDAAAWGITTAIVQPNKNPSVVRQALLSVGWRLADESFVEERGRLRIVQVFSQSVGAALGDLDPADRLLGPQLRERGGPLFARWVALELAWRGPRAEAMTAAGDPDAEQARTEVALLHEAARRLPRDTTGA